MSPKTKFFCGNYIVGSVVDEEDVTALPYPTRGEIFPDALIKCLVGLEDAEATRGEYPVEGVSETHFVLDIVGAVGVLIGDEIARGDSAELLDVGEESGIGMIFVGEPLSDVLGRGHGRACRREIGRQSIEHVDLPEETRSKCRPKEWLECARLHPIPPLRLKTEGVGVDEDTVCVEEECLYSIHSVIGNDNPLPRETGKGISLRKLSFHRLGCHRIDLYAATLLHES